MRCCDSFFLFWLLIGIQWSLVISFLESPGEVLSRYRNAFCLETLLVHWLRCCLDVQQRASTTGQKTPHSAHLGDFVSEARLLFWSLNKMFFLFIGKMSPVRTSVYLKSSDCIKDDIKFLLQKKSNFFFLHFTGYIILTCISLPRLYLKLYSSYIAHHMLLLAFTLFEEFALLILLFSLRNKFTMRSAHKGKSNQRFKFKQYVWTWKHW